MRHVIRGGGSNANQRSERTRVVALVATFLLLMAGFVVSAPGLMSASASGTTTAKYDNSGGGQDDGKNDDGKDDDGKDDDGTEDGDDDGQHHDECQNTDGHEHDDDGDDQDQHGDDGKDDGKDDDGVTCPVGICPVESPTGNTICKARTLSSISSLTKSQTNGPLGVMSS